MSTITTSPLAMLVRQGIEALRACDLGPAEAAAQKPSETVEQLAGGLLAAMGFKEIADDLDLRAIALLGAGAVAGLQLIEKLEPTIYRVEDALYSLEDLLRRTAPGRG